MNRTRLVKLEVLEDRTVPALFGTPWPDAEHLTVSFVPDGTAVGTAESDLFRLLDARYGRDVWQGEILRAVQTWVQEADLNVGLVADDGSPLGATGALQGDARFGDIRVAAVPMEGVIATASPFEPLAGTWSGDVKLNSLAFQGEAVPDLYSVVLHELGHSFGLAHEEDEGSVMFEEYVGDRAGLAPEDVAHLQALYGSRPADAFDARHVNDTLERASALMSAGGSFQATADLTTAADVDYYRLPLLSRQPTTITLKTAGLSLLRARLSVLDDAGRVLASSAALGPGGDLVITLTPEAAVKARYLRVEQADADFAVGAYRLDVVSALSSKDPVRGDSPTLSPSSGPVVILQQRFTTTDERFDYVHQGGFAAAGEVNWYRFQAPTPKAGDGQVMTLMVWGAGTGLRPSVELFDSAGNSIDIQVLVNQDGNLVVQAADVPGGSSLMLAVHNEGGTAGNYTVGIDFGFRAIPLDPIVTDHTLSDAGGERAVTLNLAETQLTHLVLSAAGGGVRLTVLDGSGAVVATLTAAAGETVSATPLLLPGAYGLWVEPLAGADGLAAPPAYSLSTLGLSDPIGPQPVDLGSASVMTGTSTAVDYVYWWEIGFGPTVTPSTSPSITTTTPTTTTKTTTTPTTTTPTTTSGTTSFSTSGFLVYSGNELDSAEETADSPLSAPTLEAASPEAAGASGVADLNPAAWGYLAAEVTSFLDDPWDRVAAAPQGFGGFISRWNPDSE